MVQSFEGCPDSVVLMQDKAGLSAAAVAAYGGHVECVARVLDSTAIASDRGMSALHLAVQVSRPVGSPY